MSGTYWTVGELAKATNLTVRTLHHYDEVGLLTPSQRSAAGHRRYTDADVRRLYRIMALRQLGLGLDEISTWLERGGAGVHDAVRQHLAAVQRQLEHYEQLQQRLTRILDALDHAGEPSTHEFIDVIEVIVMLEKYYTPEQLVQLEARRLQLGDEAIAQATRDWATLHEELKAEFDRGTAPADERVQALVRWANELIEQFTGGDSGIRQSLQTMYEQEGAKVASRGLWDGDPALDRYWQEAMRAAR